MLTKSPLHADNNLKRIRKLYLRSSLLAVQNKFKTSSSIKSPCHTIPRDQQHYTGWRRTTHTASHPQYKTHVRNNKRWKKMEKTDITQVIKVQLHYYSIPGLLWEVPRVSVWAMGSEGLGQLPHAHCLSPGSPGNNNQQTGVW